MIRRRRIKSSAAWLTTACCLLMSSTIAGAQESAPSDTLPSATANSGSVDSGMAPSALPARIGSSIIRVAEFFESQAARIIPPSYRPIKLRELQKLA
ncbi:MAG: hypothetical protein AAGA03_03160, partial [Planctomycetota bacterium]